MFDKITSKVKLGMKLDNYEKAVYLLFIANEKEADEFLKSEKELDSCLNWDAKKI
jgi:hypothetical protein